MVIILTSLSKGILRVYNAVGHEIRMEEANTETVVMEVADRPTPCYVIRAASGLHTRVIED